MPSRVRGRRVGEAPLLEVRRLTIPRPRGGDACGAPCREAMGGSAFGLASAPFDFGLAPPPVAAPAPPAAAAPALLTALRPRTGERTGESARGSIGRSGGGEVSALLAIACKCAFRRFRVSCADAQSLAHKPAVVCSAHQPNHRRLAELAAEKEMGEDEETHRRHGGDRRAVRR